MWAASCTVRVGDYHVGIRSNSSWTDAQVRRLLGAQLVDDPAAPPNYSLQLEPPAPAGAQTRPLHRLFEHGRELVVGPSPAVLLAALLDGLRAFAPPSPRHVEVWATTLVGPSGAVLAPLAWRRSLPLLRRALQRSDWSVRYTPFASLDRHGHLMPASALPTMDPATRAELAPDGARRDPSPVRVWLLASGDPVPGRAGALVAGMRQVRNRRAASGRAAFETLAAVCAEAQIEAVPGALTDTAAAAAVVSRLSA